MYAHWIVRELGSSTGEQTSAFWKSIERQIIIDQHLRPNCPSMEYTTASKLHEKSMWKWGKHAARLSTSLVRGGVWYKGLCSSWHVLLLCPPSSRISHTFCHTPHSLSVPPWTWAWRRSDHLDVALSLDRQPDRDTHCWRIILLGVTAYLKYWIGSLVWFDPQWVLTKVLSLMTCMIANTPSVNTAMLVWFRSLASSTAVKTSSSSKASYVSLTLPDRDKATLNQCWSTA